jgi:hypothetical protein
VEIYFFHGLAGLNEIESSHRDWVSQMKKAGKIKFFGISTHSNMEDCLLAAAKVDYIDVSMFTYNFRLMHTEKMKEAVAACVEKGIGLVAFKSQGGGPVKTRPS